MIGRALLDLEQAERTYLIILRMKLVVYGGKEYHPLKKVEEFIHQQ